MTVYTITTKDKARAAHLVGEHGFRVVSDSPLGYKMNADAMAYASLRGE